MVELTRFGEDAMPRGKLTKGWQAEFRRALEACAALNPSERMEVIHDSTVVALAAILPAAFRKCSFFLNQPDDKKIELAMSFLCRMKESIDRQHRWMVQYGRKKKGESFAGFGGMQPLLKNGPENGNGDIFQQQETVDVPFERVIRG